MEAFMAYVARHSDFLGGQPLPAPRRPATPAEPHRPGFWRRLLDAVVLSHQREAQRDIEAYVARRGKLTDSVEREIANRITSGRWGAGG
jgi:hypothetical protein